MLWGIIHTCLNLFVCSANSRLTSLDLSGNLMSAAALKAIEVEFVLCQMRNPAVSKINASNKGFDNQDAIKIADGLRYVLRTNRVFYMNTSKETSCP